MAGIARRPGTIYSVLTPNLRGFNAAAEAKADEVVIFGAASEAFSQRNINCSIAESIARFEPVAEAAKAAGLRLRGSISRSEEHTSELQSLMRISYAVFCLKKKNNITQSINKHYTLIKSKIISYDTNVIYLYHLNIII